MPPTSNGPVWYLESFASDSKSLWRFPLRGFPVRVGRRPGIGLSLPSPLISQDHAEIYLAAGTLKIRDLGSTNGTFVNSARLADGEAMALRTGDVLHFANMEFLLGRLAPGERGTLSLTHTALHHTAPRNLVDHARQLNTMLRKRAVVTTLQPIVQLESGKAMGYEVLGRGASAGLPRNPGELFDIAAKLGLAAELSYLFRAVGAPRLRGIAGTAVLFLNTHPAELEKPGFIDSLHGLRRELPRKRLALEIHEQAVTSPRMVRELRHALNDLDILLAYDDFGAGRGRINELVEVPPDYLKFDVTLIQGVDRAPAAKRKLLQALVQVCREGGIRTLAEGVETEGEARALRELGFDLAQGYLFGKPAPVPTKRKPVQAKTARKRVPAKKKKTRRESKGQTP